MTWIAVAIGGSALVAGGASYAGSSKQAKGAKNSAALQMQQFQTLNRQQQPYIQSGYGALGRLNTLMGINSRPRQQMPAPQYQPGAQPMMGGGQMGQMRIPPGENGGGGGMGNLNQLLQMRAMHGDTQAASLLERLQ